MEQPQTLSGKRVLIVEDDYYIASDLASRLGTMGIDVIGPVADVRSALREIQNAELLAGAILDINLGGEMVFPVADELERLALPFIFATGYDPQVVPARHGDKILLRKPLEGDALAYGLLNATYRESVSQKEARENRLLSALSADQLNTLAPLMQKVFVPRGSLMELQNQAVSRVYFPLDCIASVIVIAPDGTRIESGLIGREGMTGYGLAVGDPQTPYELLMQIEGYSVVMAAEDFRQAAAQMPSLRLLASRFARALAVQVSYTALANGKFELRQRLARWLLMVHDRVRGFSFNLTHEYLATMLGVRRSSVTDALHILEGDGMIRSTRNQIVIRDRNKLAVLAGPAYGVPEAEYWRLMALPLHGETAETSSIPSISAKLLGGVHTN